MTKHLFSFAALGALAACSASALPPASEEALVAPAHTYAERVVADVNCDVLFTRTSHGLRIEGVAHSTAPFAGEYDLVVTKDGPSGSSDINQGGEFAVHAGEEVTLGSSEFNVSRGDHYRARLSLSDGDEEICRAEQRS